VVEGAGPSPEKKSSFITKVIILGAFDAVFNRQKPRDTDFTVQPRNDAYKSSAKNCPKNHGQTRGRSHNRPP